MTRVPRATAPEVRDRTVHRRLEGIYAVISLSPRLSVHFLLRHGLVAVVLMSLATACVAPEAEAPVVPAMGVGPSGAAPYQAGLATWYGNALAGHRTASGEPFDPNAMTAAHRTLPLGTWVEVTRADTGQRVRVRINDRGPFGDARRVIDLSRAAADALDLRRQGVGQVELRVVGGPY